MPGHTPGTGVARGDAGGPLLVAVSLDSSPAVVRCAAQAAQRLLVGLVVVHVDEARGPGFTRPDGTVIMLPIDPDLPDDVNAASIRALRATVGETLAMTPIPWRWEERFGPAARVLAELADELDSPCIVLGARTKVCCTRSPDSPKGPSQPNLRCTRCGPCLWCPARIRRRTGTCGSATGIQQPALVDLVG